MRTKSVEFYFSRNFPGDQRRKPPHNYGVLALANAVTAILLIAKETAILPSSSQSFIFNYTHPTKKQVQYWFGSFASYVATTLCVIH
jgi:hypothetical protein